MKINIFILALLIMWGCAKEQQPIEKVANDSKVDTIQSWIKIVKTAKELSLDDRQQYLKDAEAMAGTITNDTNRLEQFSNISLTYKNIGDSLNFRRTNNQMQRISQESKAYKYLGYSHWDLAVFMQSKGVLDSAFHHYRKALNSFEQLPITQKSQSLKARMLYNMGRMQDSYQDYLGGEINTTAALKIFDDLEDDKRIYNCYNLLGILANGMGNSEKALEFYQKALEYLDKLDTPSNHPNVWATQNNIAHVYLRSEDYTKAKEYYGALVANDSLKKLDPKVYSMAQMSLGYSIFKTQNNLDQAEQLIKEGINTANEHNELYELARPYQYLAEVYIAKGDTVQSVQYAKKAKGIAEETFNNDRSLDVLHLLTQIDPESAPSYANEYHLLNEIVKEEERTKRNKFARISWETDQIIEANQILVEEKQAWIGAVMGLLLFGIAALVIVTLYISNSRLKFKQQQQESNQEIYNLMLSQQGKFEEGKQLEQKRISEELHDGILGEMLGIRLILTGLNEREDTASVEQRAQLIEKLRGVEEEIRTISHELNNSSYEKFHNFIVSLEDLIQGIQESSGIACSFSYDHEISWDNLLGDIKINAYRIVQESLKNCVKHANSKHVSIAFQGVDNKLKLTIMDDGVGFDMNRGKKGIGLKNIISRTKKIKGDLNIDSRKGKGTTISVIIPAKYIQSDVTLNTKTVNA